MKMTATATKAAVTQPMRAAEMPGELENVPVVFPEGDAVEGVSISVGDSVGGVTAFDVEGVFAFDGDAVCVVGVCVVGVSPSKTESSN
eukprot:m.5232 g.5232  ORF g.5232 m.5232 type:complete len:88 (+) comp12569_c0_seq1:24-287(+)